MTKEECIGLLKRYAEYDGMGIPNLAGCKEAMRMAAELLERPSPPSNLDEAAEKYGRKEYSHAIHFWDEGLSKNKPEVMKEDFVDSFKAEALNDLPKWKKTTNSMTFVNASNMLFHNGYYLGIKDLEKLPKED